MNNFVLSVSDKESNHAGPKAKEDIVKFLGEKGYRNLLLHIPKSKIRKIVYSFFELHKVFHNLKADIIAFQYPIYSLFLTKRIIKAIRRHTNAKLVLIVHDVESLRLFNDNSNHKKKETELFNMADGLIVHNKFMSSWLKKHGVTTEMVDLEIFDYDNPQDFQKDRKYDKTVCFAGNLAKASFLSKVSLENGFFVYGPNPAEHYPAGIKYAGQYSPSELPKYLTQSFGLVWDGSGLSECDGVFGHYMKYNNPHKVSLYLSSGLPVVVWEKAAVADFVKKYRVGIAINDLSTLEEVLNNISEEQYIQMQSNAIAIGEKMRQGFYIQHAIKKLVSSWV